MLAGNILGKTRTVSVAIAAETAAGNYECGRFLGCGDRFDLVCDRGTDKYCLRQRHEEQKVDLMALQVNIEKNFKGFSLKDRI